jgi:tRNA wybutosine-synthesizing protein 1
MQEFIKFNPEQQKTYEKAGYKLVGKNKHSAVQLCRWTKSKIKGERNCYKSVYGIKSHRCIQITPTIDFCDFSCTFCWRKFGKDRFKSENKWDSPKEIVDGVIEAQRKLISGFGGNKEVTKQNFAEANDPHHVAISLDGEPTLYPYIADLIKEIKSRNMTVFIVTNATMPNRVKELLDKDAEPDNLSISVYATNKEDYKKVTNSFIEDEFEKVKQTLDLMKFFKTARTIMRTTLVKGLNDHNAEEFADLINKYQPKFVQLKGYSWLGESKKRLKLSNMPTMKEIDEYGDIISNKTGYIAKLKDKVSRVIIFVKDEKVWKWNFEKIKEQDKRLSQRPKSNFQTKKVLKGKF